MFPLLDTEELLLIFGPTHSLLPRPTDFVLLGLPSGLFSAVDGEVGDVWEGSQHVLRDTQVLLRRSERPCGRPGTELVEEQGMNVAADVGGVHLGQHAQEMYREVKAQVQQGQGEKVRNVKFERMTGSDLTLAPDPEEVEKISPDLEGFDLLCQVGERC